MSNSQLIHRELAFVIDDTEAPDQLLDSLPAHVHAIVINHQEDALSQIALTLRACGPLRAIHLFCHGSPGALSLGTVRLDQSNLHLHQHKLAEIARALSGGGDLLLYGCEVAEGTQGIDFIFALGIRLRANIAAAKGVVGAGALGGSWNLDYQFAQPKTMPLALPSYQGIFGNGSVTFYVRGAARFDNLSVGDIIEARVSDPNGFNPANVTYTWVYSSNGFGSYTVLTTGTGDAFKTYQIPWSVSEEGIRCLVTYTDNASGAESVSATSWYIQNPVVVPVNISASGLEDAAAIVIPQSALETDVYSYAPSDIHYQFASAAAIPTVGKLYLGTLELKEANSGFSFTQADINAGRLTFVPNPDYNGTVVLDLAVYTTDYKSQLAHLNVNIAVAPQNDPLGGEVTISGDAVQGSTLSLNDALTDIDVINTATKVYQWQWSADGATGWQDISGANGTDLQLGIPEASRFIRVKTTYVDYGGTPETYYSDPTARVIPNTAPTIATNNGLTLNEDAAATKIRVGALEIADAEQGPASLVYTITSKPTHGTLKKGSTVLDVNSTFTQDDINNERITFTPYADENGSDSFMFTVSDGAGGIISATTFSITINPVNDVPSVDTNSGLTVAEDAAATSLKDLLVSSDLEQGSALTYRIDVAPGHGKLFRNTTLLGPNDTFTQAELDGGLVKYQPDADYNDVDGFQFSVLDGVGGVRSGQSFSFTVTPVNDAPTGVVTASGTKSEGQTLTASTSALDDIDGLGAFSYQWQVSSDGGATWSDIVGATGVSHLLTSAQGGKQVRVVTSYVDGGNTLESVDGTAYTINSRPTIVTNAGLTVDEDAVATTLKDLLVVADLEQSAAARVYTLTSVSANGKLKKDSAELGVGSTFTQDDIDSGRITFTPNPDANGSGSFKFTVSDGVGGSIAETTFSIAINPVNDAPTIVTNAGLTVNEDAAATSLKDLLVVADLEQAATARVFTLTSVSSNGKLKKDATELGVGSSFTQDDIDNGRITFTPNPDANGSGSFKFTVSDGAGGSIAETTFSIAINPVNDAPTIAINAGLTVDEDAVATSLKDLLVVTDLEQSATARVYTLTNVSSNGKLKKDATELGVGSTFTQDDIDSGRITFTPNADANGSGSFKFTVSDGVGGALAETTFSIAINPVNDAPTIVTNVGLTIDEDAAATPLKDLLVVTDLEQSAAARVYTLTNVSANGKLKKDAAELGVGSSFTQDDIDSGRITFTPNADASGSGSFKFTVSDGAGGSIAETTFSIAINPVNDAPTILTNAGLTVDEDAAATSLKDLLVVADLEQAATARVFTLTSVSANGKLKKDATELGIGSTFTQDDIDSGRITFTPNPDANGSGSFKFTVSDGVGGSIVETTFSIAINPVNDAPTIAINAGLTMDEDAAASTLKDLLVVADLEQAATARVFTLTSVSSNGKLKKDAAELAVGSTFTQDDIDSGRITFTPHADASGSGSFKFTVSDGAGGSIAETTFSITINPVNDAPTIVTNAGLTVDEDAAATSLKDLLVVADLEQAATARVYTLTNVSSNGKLKKDATELGVGSSFTQDDIDNGRITFTPNPDANGSGSFKFTVSDGAGGSIAETTFSIAINPVNDAPTIVTNVGLTVDEDAAATSLKDLLVVADLEQATTARVYTLTDVSSNGKLKKDATELGIGSTFTQDDIDNGRITFTPNPDASGSGSFKFTVSDGAGGSIVETTFSIAINPVNDAPTIAINAGLTMDEDAAASTLKDLLVVADLEQAATARVFTLTSVSSNGKLKKDAAELGVGSTFTQDDIDSGRITFTPNANASGSGSFKFTVSDGVGGALAETTFSIAINPVNDAPTIVTNAGLTVDEDAVATSLKDLLVVADLEQSATARVFTLTNVSSNGKLKKGATELGVGSTFTQDDIDSGRITFAPNPDANGSGSFKFTVSDGAGGSIAETTFSIAINPVNDAPTIVTNAGLTVDEDAAATSLKDLLVVADLEQAATARVFTLTSVSANGKLKKDATELGIGSTFTQDDIDSGRITFTPNPDANGSGSFKFTVSDGVGGSIAETTFSIAINPVNDAPTIAINAGLTMDEDAAASTLKDLLVVADLEQAATARVFTLTSVSSNGKLKKDAAELGVGSTFTQDDIDSGRITFTPNANASGSGSFKFTVSDGVGGSISETTFSITINPVNDAPEVVTNAGLTVDEDATATSLKDLLMSSDVEQGTALTYQITAAPGHGKLFRDGTELNVNSTFTQADLDNDLITFKPTADYAGNDRFVFSLLDSASGILPGQSFSITVTPVNDAPVLVTNLGIIVAEDAPKTSLVNLLVTSDVDTPAANLTYTIDAPPSHGTLFRGNTPLGVNSTFTQADLNAGLIAYKPAANYNSNDGFGFKVSDGAGGLVSTQNFAITVSPINDAPTGTVITPSQVLGGGVIDAQLRIADADGLGTPHYQWQVSANGTAWTNLAAADLPNYTVASGDVGKYFRVQVNYVDGGGTAESVFSNATFVGELDEDDDADPWSADKVPNLSNSGRGDGNGDGILDVLQKHVTSLPMLPQADGLRLFITVENALKLNQRDIRAVDLPASTPLDLVAPSGLVTLAVDNVPVGQSLQFRSFVDAASGFAGFWMRDSNNNWVNVSEDHTDRTGGTPRKIDFDFTVVDGGRFDADGVANGVIVLIGGPGEWVTDRDRDGIPNSVELQIGTNPFLRDNAVQSRTDLFVMQVYRDVFGVEAPQQTVTDLAKQIDTNVKSRAEVVHAMVNQQLGMLGNLPKLYFATFGEPLAKNELDYWVRQTAHGELGQQFFTSNVYQSAIADKSDEAFVDLLYQHALQRKPDEGGQAYWLDQLHHGMERAGVVELFAASSEFSEYFSASVEMAAVYSDVLGRVPDAAGLKYWTSVKLTGVSNTDIIDAFLGSTEYHVRFGGD